MFKNSVKFSNYLSNLRTKIFGIQSLFISFNTE
jgi:hypothetical protein